jgi:hypothetical protein
MDFRTRLRTLFLTAASALQDQPKPSRPIPVPYVPTMTRLESFGSHGALTLKESTQAPDDDERVCPRCMAAYPLNFFPSFYDRKQGKSYTRALCRDCHNEQNTERRQTQRVNLDQAAFTEPFQVIRPSDPDLQLPPHPIWELVNITHPKACWEWTGRISKGTYPYLTGDLALRYGGSPFQLIWRLVGRPPVRMIRHTCKNRTCMNPGHMTGRRD